MHKKAILIVVTALVLPFILTAEEAKTPASGKKKPAAEKKAEDNETGKPSDKPKLKRYPYYGEVTAVSPRILTLKGPEGAENRKLSISAETKIVKGDKTAAFEDIAVGKWVGGSAEKTEAGNERAITINLGVKQKGAKPQPKAEEKSKKAS